MVKKEQILNFYEDVEKLGIKFPVATISEKTGFSKGNVSEILSKKREPSEAFLKSFYSAFSSQIVPSVTNQIREVSESYITKRRQIKNGDGQPVPMYGSFTTLGNIEVFDDDNNRHKVVAQLPAEIFPGCDFGILYTC